MIYFHNDYHEGCHPKVMEKLTQLQGQQMNGYGMDTCCEGAAAKIRTACGKDDLAVHFLVGGTQTNLTVIAAALRPHHGVIGAESAHIHVHETGAVEAAGHKVLALPTEDGKISARQVEALVSAHHESGDAEHMVKPKMVYISHPTEWGTIYSKTELEELSAVCRKWGLYLFVDGARLGYGLTARDSDVTLADLALLCDVFYIGGTKVGAMFGEAVVISNPAIGEDFRYLIKQRGAMLAKGWLLGAQFDALFTDDLYLSISAHANAMAQQIRSCLEELGYPMVTDTTTNQLFPILPDDLLSRLCGEVTFSEMHRVDESHRAVRFCTSWATTQQQVDILCNLLRQG